MSETVLYDYWRSSASYRVRIGLNIAGIAFTTVPVDLLSAAQTSPEHLARNPQGLVPVLDIDGLRLTQSMAILEYLAETRPQSRLLPSDAAGRARVRALACAIAMEIHAVCNLRVVNAVIDLAGNPDETRRSWMQKFIGEGLAAVEAMLDDPATGMFCHGDTPTIADLCLMPQLYNAARFDVPLDSFTHIQAIAAACETLLAFQQAVPVKPAP